MSDLTALKIEELNALKSKVTTLESGFEILKEKFTNLLNSNEKNFDKMFSELKQINQNMEKVARLEGRSEMQTARLSDIESRLTGLSTGTEARFEAVAKEIKDLINYEDKTRAMLEFHIQEDRVKRETTKENIGTLQKILALARWIVPGVLGFLAAKGVLK